MIPSRMTRGFPYHSESREPSDVFDTLDEAADCAVKELKTECENKGIECPKIVIDDLGLSDRKHRF